MKMPSYIIDAFKKSIERKCITLLVSAYHSSIVNSDYTTAWMENDFTSMIDKYINLDDRRIEWGIFCNIEHHLHDNSIQKEKGFANKEKRIDMKFSNISNGMEFHFYVEAKRLVESDNKLNKRYIQTGIDNYLTKKYPQGILVGYVIKGNIHNIIQQINNILIETQRNGEILAEKSHPIHNSYYESNHTGFGIIKHFMFDFTI